MPYVGPTQPMAGGGAVQENFGQMVNHILTYNPDCPDQLAKRRINARLRQLEDRRMWGGLLARGELSLPAAYVTGLIAAVRGSDIITGSATLWPYNDLLNTTLSQAITVSNELQDVFPASMAGIEPGDFLTFDAAGASPGGPNREFMLVVSVGQTSFKARPILTHNAGEPIYKSSLMRRQFRLGNTRPFYTIQGVTAAQEIKIDLPYGHTSSPSSAYQIVKAYVQFGQALRMVFTVVNTAQGWRLKTSMPQEVLNVYDTWRQTTGWSYMLADYIPDEIGRMQYEVYPTPSMEQGFPYLAYRTIPNLVDEDDTPPPCIPSHILVHGALSDVLLFNRKSPYYDALASKNFGMQFEADYQAAAMADDSIYMQNLQWAYSRYPFQQHGAAYWQSHDVDSVLGAV